MPRSDTDIPHVAFTHHRIGKHRPRPAADTGRVPDLVAMGDVSHLSAIDRQRGLGLAYYFAAESEERELYETEFRRRARSILEEVHSAGLRDGAVATALAELHWKTDRTRTRRYADQALEATDLSPDNRAMALMLLATCDFEDRDFKSAIRRLEEVTRLRRLAEDWRLLGVCYLLDDQPRPALKAMEQALAIRPFRHNIHGGMFEVYRRLGDGRRAQEHLEKAQWLERNRQE
jgi:tetratricopeptide (TPR) repeat protein